MSYMRGRYLNNPCRNERSGEREDHDCCHSNCKKGQLHPTVDAMLKYFKYEHLPRDLQEISKSICELVSEMVVKLPNNDEKIAGLRKLLEAKDCFIRSMEQ